MLAEDIAIAVITGTEKSSVAEVEMDRITKLLIRLSAEVKHVYPGIKNPVTNINTTFTARAAA